MAFLNERVSTPSVLISMRFPQHQPFEDPGLAYDGIGFTVDRQQILWQYYRRKTQSKTRKPAGL